jgi:hypothetical protein
MSYLPHHTAGILKFPQPDDYLSDVVGAEVALDEPLHYGSKAIFAQRHKPRDLPRDCTKDRWMDQQWDAETYSPEETQRRFEAALRAALTTPHQRQKDVPRSRLESKRKVEKAAKPSPSEPS